MTASASTLRRAAPASKLSLAGRVLDLDAGNLIDLDGAPIALRPQAWSLLCVLARHAGSIVTKSDLLDAVWPGLVVTDSSLAKAVSDLRAAFGSDGRAVIQTAARRGYRLLASAAEPAAGPAPPSVVLPVARGPLFGRDAELASVRALLAQNRLVSIVGAGGVGKTAVAIAAARAHAAEQESSAAWVDLAQLADPSLLIATIARALGQPVAQRGEQLPGLLAALAPLTTLLVLDNAEHLIAGVARLTRSMLDAAPGLRVLVTSQAPLRLEGEQLFRLVGLEVPAAGEPIDEASRRGAVALLMDQACAVGCHFEMTAANAELAIELCRRLDGFPLAIRLAAARLPLLGLAGVVSRLDERLQLLAAQGRDAPARQQTLLAALDWSHGLLSPQEQALFHRLGVFVGGFSLDLAVAFAACEGIDEWTLIERLNVLVERNLVDVDHAPQPRYRMLETQRDYASGLLRSSGDMAAVRRDHVRAVASMMLRGFEELWTLTDAAWLPRWAAELDNVRAALDWSAANETALFAQLVGSVGHLFGLLDLSYELRQRAAAVSPEILERVGPELMMRYWLTRAFLEAGLSARAARDFACRTERAARIAADDGCLYLALCLRLAFAQEMPADTAQVLAEIAALESPAWPPRMRAHRFLAEYAVNLMHGGRWAQAEVAAQAGLAAGIEGGSVHMQGAMANGVLVALLGQNRVRAAVERSHELRSLVLRGPSGSTIPFIGTSARCALAAGDMRSARRLLAQLFDVCRAVGWTFFEFFATLYVTLALTEGRSEAAARLLGHADVAAQRSWGIASTQATRDAARSALAAKLAPERLASLLDEGARLSRESVCAWVLEGGQAGSRAPALTARQVEVLRLVSNGQTDKQVARTLGLSPRTVEMHVARAIDALACSNRADAVRVAVERRLMD